MSAPLPRRAFPALLCPASLCPALLAATLLLGACGEAARPAPPREIASDTVCVLDGMRLADFPGPKAQIHYAQGDPDFFCDTKEMFAIVLRPEQQRQIVAIYTQDMAKADWTRPESNWIDARAACKRAASCGSNPRRTTTGSLGNGSDSQTTRLESGLI